MPFDAPFHLGPFAVGPDGRLALASPDRAPRFQIDWRSCRVEAWLDSTGALSLRAVVGRVPSTAIAADQRDAVFAALRALPATLPPGWHAELLADHRLVLHGAAHMAMPTMVDRMLTEVTLFLLALGPYLDLLAGLGVEGMANTCPG